MLRVSCGQSQNIQSSPISVKNIDICHSSSGISYRARAPPPQNIGLPHFSLRHSIIVEVLLQNIVIFCLTTITQVGLNLDALGE
jgi:hypothetical protein